LKKEGNLSIKPEREKRERGREGVQSSTSLALNKLNKLLIIIIKINGLLIEASKGLKSFTFRLNHCGGQYNIP